MAAMGTWVEISWRACLALAFGVYTQRHAKLLPVASKRTSFDSSVGRAFDCSGYMDHRMATGSIPVRGNAAFLLPPPQPASSSVHIQHQPEPKIPYAMYPCGASARDTICIWGGFDSGVDEKMKEGKQVPWYMRACNARRGAQLLSRAHL